MKHRCIRKERTLTLMTRTDGRVLTEDLLRPLRDVPWPRPCRLTPEEPLPPAGPEAAGGRGLNVRLLRVAGTVGTNSVPLEEGTLSRLRPLLIGLVSALVCFIREPRDRGQASATSCETACISPRVARLFESDLLIRLDRALVGFISDHALS